MDSLHLQGEILPFEQKLMVARLKASRDNRKITIQDFGAGSKKLGNERQIADIYKTSVASKKYQRLIYQLSKKSECSNILEMGTSLGFSSVYLAHSTTGVVRTIEACENTANEAKKLFSSFELKNVLTFNMTFKDYFELENTNPYDFVYIDGHHNGTALLNYVEILKPQLASNAILVLDDIRWSKDMLLSWKKLKEDPFFRSSVDLFRMGVLSC